MGVEVGVEMGVGVGVLGDHRPLVHGFSLLIGMLIDHRCGARVSTVTREATSAAFSSSPSGASSSGRCPSSYVDAEPDVERPHDSSPNSLLRLPIRLCGDGGRVGRVRLASSPFFIS
jgi:hypothetical protein